MRKRWLLLPAAALIAVSAALVNASVSGARATPGPTTTNVYAWIGLKNSDDVGTKFELKAEVTNGSARGTASSSNFSGGSSGFNNAQLATIPVTNYVGTLGSRSASRSGSGFPVERHTSGTARLWWNDTPRTAGWRLRLRHALPDRREHAQPVGRAGAENDQGRARQEERLYRGRGGGTWQPFGTWTEPETNSTVSATVTGGNMTGIHLIDDTDSGFNKDCFFANTARP